MVPPVPEIDRDQDQVLESFTGPKHFQADAEGYNLYFTKAESERYNIDPDAEVTEEYVVRDGRVEWFGHADLNAGFSQEELREHADSEGWRVTDVYEGSRWSYSFEEPEQGTIISVDKPSIVDGRPLNNVFTKSREVILEPGLSEYEILKAVSFNSEIEVTIRDSEGLWQRLQESSAVESPDTQVLTQLVNKADIVTAHLSFEIPSVWISLEQLNLVVEEINEGISPISEEKLVVGWREATSGERSA